jgi:hypothetical protein
VHGLLGGALPDGLANDLSSIADRHVAALFVFSQGDNGLAYFQAHATPAVRRANVRRYIRHVVVERAGHAFRPLKAQQTLRTLLIDFVDNSKLFRAATPPRSQS